MTQIPPEQIRQITEDTLARPEFLHRPTWTQLALGKISEWFEQLARWSVQNPDSARILLYILSFVLAVLIIHIVYTVVREFVGMRKRDDPSARKRPMRALEGVAESWSEAFRLARAALETGDLYQAVSITHRILLSVLDRMDRIKFARWKTNTDYLREC